MEAIEISESREAFDWAQAQYQSPASVGEVRLGF
jgi:hypothetical protein